MLIEKLKPRAWDARREIVVPGDMATTLIFCVEHFVTLAAQSIKEKGAFYVALSGGSTPKAIFQTLSSPPYNTMVPWGQCHLFWSDERAVPPDHPDSNYQMAMQAGLASLPIPLPQIHRMCAETDIEAAALRYEQALIAPFDLVMLGMGEDGHTASLFPGTAGLTITDRLVIANFIPQKNCWRMTLTYPCINSAAHIAIYVLGAPKKKALAEILFSTSDTYPINQVGTPTHKALWIADETAAEELSSRRHS
jgi:6-phosphogluconolactonase